MALQDLTPQLRTRMSRVERLVGVFVVVAALLVLAGFSYYLINLGRDRGWFVHKVTYYCYLKDATGLKPGDSVRLLGRDIGRIVKVETASSDPWFVERNYNIFVKFEVRDPYFGYILTDSRIRVVSSDFFGARYIELTRGDQNVGLITVGAQKRWEDRTVRSDKNTNDMVLLSTVKEGVWLQNLDETPSLADHATQIAQTLAQSLPTLTNQIGQVLAQAGQATSNANLAVLELRPALAHLEALAARLRSEEGVIGRMVLTTNLQGQVTETLASMNATLTTSTALVRTSETELRGLTRRLADTLDSVSLVTSNLAGQVNANSLVLGEVSSLVVNADTMVEGLKRHWFLRSAFAIPPTNPPLRSVVTPSLDAPVR